MKRAVAKDVLQRFWPIRQYRERIGARWLRREYLFVEMSKAHGGTLSVISSVEETRFMFTMPL